MPDVQYDDLFIYAPSFGLYEQRGHLLEGKSIGTAKEADLVFLDKDRSMDAFLQPEQFAKQRKIGQDVGRRILKRVQDRVYRDLLKHAVAHDDGETWNTDFKTEVTKVMRRAWRDVFVAGVRAAGIRTDGEFSSSDEAWLKSATKHEMRFLNRFVEAVTEQTYQMPLERRTRMYADALTSFYDSARVIGMPSGAVFRWTGRTDSRVCESCLYLKSHNPYHKKNLPTTPRSGMTLCLTNCRDRLLVRMVGSDEALRVLQKGPSREQHIRKLQAIKRKARGGRRRR